MKLRDWINSHPRDERVALRKALAEHLGVSENLVRSMANGNRPIRDRFAIPIEEFTGGKVRRHESRPDLYPAPAAEAMA